MRTPPTEAADALSVVLSAGTPAVVGITSTVLVGVAFGLALAAPPGPMNAIIAEESVLRGWTAGFTAGLGAATADAAFFVAALAGAVTVVERLPRLRAVMVTVGGLLMLYFAVDAVRDVRETFSVDGAAQRRGTDGIETGGDRGRGTDGGTGETTTGWKGFRRALVLALTNPYQILFWLTVGVGLLRPGRLDLFAHVPYAGQALSGVLVVETGSPALLVGFFAGIVVWIVGFPALLVSAGRRIDRFAPAVAVLSAVVLAGFGLTFLFDGLGRLL